MPNILLEATALCSKFGCKINAPIVLLEYIDPIFNLVLIVLIEYFDLCNLFGCKTNIWEALSDFLSCCNRSV